MATKTLRVTTDKGTYDVEVDIPEAPIDKGALRGSSQSAMILNSMDDAAKGFFKGVLPGAVGAVTGLIPAVVKGMVGTVKGAGNLANDPVKTLTEAWEAIKGSPGKGADMLKQALDLAKKDPEAFGKQVGELTGGVEAGIGMGAVAPIVPGTAGRAIGSTMEAAGTHGKWPIRMMGAHQLGSGNPLGLVTMMTPEGLIKGGRALRLGSTPVGAVAGEMPTRFLELQQDINAGAPDVLPRIQAMQDELTAARQGAKVPEQIKDLQRQQTQLDRLRKSATPKPPGVDKAAAAAEKEAQDVRDAAEKVNAKMAADRAKAQTAADTEAAKVRAAEAKKEGTTPKTKYSETVSGTTPEGVKKSATTTYAPDEPVGVTPDEFETDMRKAGLDPNKVVSKSMPKAGDVKFGGGKVTESQAQRNDAMRAEAPPGMPFADRTTEDRLFGRQGLEERRVAAQGASPTGTERRVGQDVETLADAGSGQMRSGSNLPGAMTPTEMLPGPEAGPMESEMGNRMSAAARSMDIAPNQGSNGPLMHGKFSPNDMMELEDIIKNNQGIGLADAASLLKARRTVRQGAYRTNAGMDSVAQALMDREP